MRDGFPKVSFGMPVYNGERFLDQALDSLLSQSFEDFELLIADNASTDATQAICQSYAARDPRVRYVRNRENYGVVANFNNVFRLTSGRYFKWAAYDDVCAPDFLTRCVDVLDGDRDVVLACSRIAGIDDDGHRIPFESIPGPGQPRVADRHLDMDATISAAAADPIDRWRAMLRDLWWTPQLYGLIRADVLARTRLHAAHFAGDHILLAELALHGCFHEVPEDLLFVRIHPQKTSRVSGARQRLTVAHPNVEQRSWLIPLELLWVYPHRFAAHAASVWRAPLTARQRFRCWWELLIAGLRWAGVRAAGSFGRA